MAFLDKDMEKEYKHKWYLENKSRLIKEAENYVTNHRARIKNYKAQWYLENKAKIKSKMQSYYVRNKEGIKKRVKNYYLRNHIKIICNSKEYQLSHKKERNNYAKQRYFLDEKYKLNCSMANAIGKCLKKKRASKRGRSWEKLLNFSKEKLEKQLFKNKKLSKDFLKSKLDIDHKVPLAWFSFSSEKDLAFRNAWSLDNLQLLPSKENNKKRHFYCADVMLALSLIGRS